MTLLFLFSLALAETNHGELFRSYINGLGANAHSVDYFRKLYDEHATYYFNMGNISPADEIHGVENIQKAFAMWFPKGSDAKAGIDTFFETSDKSVSFVTGTYSFTLPSKEHTSYKVRRGAMICASDSLQSGPVRPTGLATASSATVFGETLRTALRPRRRERSTRRNYEMKKHVLPNGH